MKFWPFSIWQRRQKRVEPPADLADTPRKAEESAERRHKLVQSKQQELMLRLNYLELEAQQDVGFYPQRRDDKNPPRSHA